MLTRKIFRRTLLMLFTISILFANIAYAEIKPYVGVGEYYMSDFETPDTAQKRAKQRAEQNACEQAGVYVKSYSRSNNFELESDIIETMTKGILKIIDVKYHREHSDDNTTLIKVTITAQIDDSDVLNWLKKDKQQISELVEQYEALKKAYEDQERQIAELKRQIANNPQNTEKITQEFADADKIFLSHQKSAEAWQLYYKNDYNGVIKLHTEAINLNPNNANAYYGRGTAYSELGQYERAIKDYNKAIELNPKYFKAYNNRGAAYYGIKQYELAIQDYTKAIELNQSYNLAYRNRGIAYDELKQYELAIKEYDKAIRLNPNDDASYNNRGRAYRILEKYDLALADYNKALQLNPNYDIAYNNRGWAYYCLNQYEKALKDFDKALELNPNYTLAKNNREACLKAMGK